MTNDNDALPQPLNDGSQPIAEHRLFSHISMNWRGKPLTSHEVIVNTIAATTTGSGLRVHAELDTNTYPTGVIISDTQLAGLPITRHDWHYTLRPDQPDPAPAAQPEIDRAWLTHPAVTGLQPAAFEELTTQITALHDIQREAILQRRRGGQRKAAPTAGPARAHSPSPSEPRQP